MMHSNWLQVELKGLLGRPWREGVAWHFFKNQIESGRVARETSEGEDKIKSNNSPDLKGLVVTQLIMSIRRKDERRDMKCSKNRRVTRLGGTQVVCWFCLNIWKLEVTRGFFPGKTCNLMLVRGTISFYNQRLQILPVGGSAVWNMSMWLNEQCWMWTISFSTVPHYL